MAEPLLISVDKATFDSLHRLAQKGEEWAAQQIEGLFDGVEEEPNCFLCDKPTGWPIPGMLVLPENDDPRRVLAVGICSACQNNLSFGQKYHRGIGILREMWRRAGKQFHVDFSPKRHHPR